MAMPVRVLGLGNELLADDAFGILVAREIERLALEGVDVICTPESGFRLLDYVHGVGRLLVVDTLLTGTAEPGTLYEVGEDTVPRTPCNSPHFVGLFETLRLARQLELPVPDEVRIVAVEAADCSTIGGAMHPAVRAAIPDAASLVKRNAESWGGEPPAGNADRR